MGTTGEIIVTTPDDIQIGMWWAECCIEELERIDNDDDLEYVRRRYFKEEMIGRPAGVWATEEAAREALKE